MLTTKAKSKLKQEIAKKVIFEYFAPDAKSVKVAGTFNNWNADESPLKKGRDGKWKTEMILPPGRYEYRYRVDESWENDQRPVECIPNTFGSWNCVIAVH